MSYYKDFLQELPKRSLKLLNSHYEIEKRSKNFNEVTLLISLAMPVFVITSELIKQKQTDKKSRISEMYKSLNDPKTNIGIFENKSEKWEYGIDESFRSLSEIKFIKDSKSIAKSGQVQLSVLSQIRNALSHGNIKFSKSNTNEIAKILFRSEKRKDVENADGTKVNNVVGHHLNLIPVDDFKILLENWCNFLINEDANSCFKILSDFKEISNAA
jgi:hypothetical protein